MSPNQSENVTIDLSKDDMAWLMAKMRSLSSVTHTDEAAWERIIAACQNPRGSNNNLRRIEAKINMLLQLEGATLDHIKQLELSWQDEAKIAQLTATLKQSSDQLKSSVVANQPK